MGLAKISPERLTDEVGDQSAADRPGLTEQDAASAARQQEALASAAAHAERARVAEHKNSELPGQFAQAQAQLAQVIHEATVAIEQIRAQAADLDDRLKASIASEREASARSSSDELCINYSSLSTAASCGERTRRAHQRDSA